MAGIKEACGVFGIYDLDGGMLFHLFIMALLRFSIGDRSPADLPFPERTESVETYSSIKISDW